MPTSFIYHALSLRYLNYKRIFLKNGKVFFAVETKPKSIKCPQCNNRNVVKRGKIVQELKSLPISARNTRIQANIQRVWCCKCNTVRQIELSFADNKKSYTKAFARYVLELSSKMTIKDIASHLNTSWDLIKSIQKEDLKRNKVAFIKKAGKY